jgi:AcrR family transcriptional regulator
MAQVRTPYHHGNLRVVLVDIALELIAERGPHGFSMAEASRRAGVSVAAPYRHFATREDLLVAAAVRAYGQMRTALADAVATATAPEDQLVRAAEAYVEHLDGHRAVYELLFASGLDKHQHPQLATAAAEVLAVLRTAADDTLGPGATPAGGDLALCVGVLAQGFTSLARDGHLPPGRSAARQAADAVRALIRGYRAP